MKMSDFIICTEYSREPIFQFSANNPNLSEIQAGLQSGELAAITGRAWQVVFDCPEDVEAGLQVIGADQKSLAKAIEEAARDFVNANGARPEWWNRVMPIASRIKAGQS
jgi:hypothetical protein